METWELPDGAVTMQKEGHMVRFRVDCKPPCEPSRLLRCYGEGAPDDLLIGVLEPLDGRLRLDRRISRETLRQSGFDEALPSRFYLSDGGPREHAPEEAPPPEKPSEEPPAAQLPGEPQEETAAPEPVPAPGTEGLPEEAEAPSAPAFPETGDALLDAVLARGEAQWEASPEGLRISCPFSPEQPFPLAFIAPLCRTENQNIAVLDWKIPKGTP